jgi:tRNA A-37 threonylcarbamoyl transferase component Bud32
MTPAPETDDSGRPPFAPSSVMPDVDLGATAPTVGNRLAAGLRLQEFEISGLLGEGGFGIVYLAWDHALQRRVVIKEYMPAALAWRVHGMQVDLKSPEHRTAFDAGLRSFVNEAKLLAMFDHPTLLKVHRFWQANGTAYMAMPFYEGVTLKQALADSNRAPDEDWLRSLIIPLLAALEYLHEASCFHRDIAPDNILLQDDGKPLLLDFGAARQVIGGMNKAITVILKPGFAPIEQYGEGVGLGQGPWTDLYAFGAVLHYAMTGAVPRVSVARVLADDYVPLARRLTGRYSERLLRAVDHMLCVRPEDRPRSVVDVRREMGLEPTRAVADITLPPRMAPDAEPWTRPRQRQLQGPGAAAAAAVVAALDTPAGRVAGTGPEVSLRPMPAVARKRRHRPTWTLLAGACAVLVAGLWAIWHYTAPVPVVHQDAAPVADAASAPLVEQDEQAASAPVSASAPVPAAASWPEAVTVPAATATATPATGDRPPSAPSAATAPVGGRDTAPAKAMVEPDAGATPSTGTPDAQAPWGRAPSSTSAGASRAGPSSGHAGARPAAGRVDPAHRGGASSAAAPRIPTSARCAEIIQRVSIGEPLTAGDRRTLKEECGR